jgi:hypothetical protein
MKTKENAMNRAILAVCAVGGFLLGLAGCNALDVAFDLAGPGGQAVGDVRVVDGSPEAVAVMLQSNMKQRGFEATIVKTTDTVVVESKTVAGIGFALVLAGRRGSDGREQTHVSMQWRDQGKDQQTSVQIFTDLDRQTNKK